ncbi:MAG: cell division protein SepF [Actinomycetota bacterium]|nr:cell division protein SepF [Actinomycetota bacterium]
MSMLWRRTLLYLGLVDEEEVEQEATGRQPPAPAQSQVRTVRPGTANRGGVPGRRVDPPANARRRVATDPAHAEAGILVHSGSLRPAGRGEGEADVVVARTFNDAQLLADRLRESVPVVLDLRETDPDMVRRLVDFASGLTYGLEGTMRKVAQGVILVLPARVSLSREEGRRLHDLGLYDLHEET